MFLIDTIAAMVKVQELDVGLFPGRAEQSNVETGRVAVRLYRNDEGSPRVTYYPASGWLRVEWSSKQFDLSGVDEYVTRFSSSLPPVLSWRCQRVDYTVDLDVERVAPYLAALGKLQVGSMRRHPFADGVVWKQGNRWVKFYNRTLRDAMQPAQRPVQPTTSTHQHASSTIHPTRETLRFEVSNYAQAVRYMAERWFACERSVAEMTRPGRALYVLARMWEAMGLQGGIAAQEREVQAVREAFGQRSLAGALHALMCIREYGTESYKSMALMSKSSYYRWRKALGEQGFLASGDSVCELALPCERVFDMYGENLKIFSSPPETHSNEKTWKNLVEFLGLSPKAPPSFYLMERFNGYLDTRTRGVQTGGTVADFQIVDPVATVAACAVE